MSGNYRVRYRNGEFEVEVESSEKSYVDSTLKELLEKEGVHSTKTSSASKTSTKKKKPVGKSNSAPEVNSENNEVDIAKLVSAINDADDHENIEKNILMKAAQLRSIRISV